MFCRECGSKLLPDSKFCDNCGTKAQAASRDAPNRDKTLIPDSANVAKEPVPEPASAPELAPTPERPPAVNTETQRNTKRSILHWYFVPLSKYADFSGRASRIEYWMFSLWNTLIAFALILIEGGDTTVLAIIYIFAMILPIYAVGVRRLHDINMSGWWLLLSLVPLLGWLFIIGTGCTDSDPNENQYGPNPKLEVL